MYVYDDDRAGNYPISYANQTFLGRPGPCPSCGYKIIACDRCHRILEYEQYITRYVVGGTTYNACPQCSQLISEISNEANRKYCSTLVQAGEDLLIAEQLDPENQAIQDNIKQIRKLASDAKIDLPSNITSRLIGRNYMSYQELEEIFAESSLQLHIEAAKSLARMKRPSVIAIDTISGHLQNGDEIFRNDCIDALVRMSSQWASSPVTRRAITALVTSLTLVKPSTQPEKKLIAALKAIDRDWPASVESKAAIPIAAGTIRDGIGNRQQLSSILHQIGKSAPEVIPEIAALLIDEDSKIRNIAIRVLDQINPNWHSSGAAKALVEKLVHTIQTGGRQHRKAAGKILRRIDPETYYKLNVKGQKKWLSKLLGPFHND